MNLEDQARQDVESTLEAGRADLERSVARGRVALFGTMAVFGAVLWTALSLTTLGEQVRGASPFARFAPVVVFGGGAVYALIVWRLLTRQVSRTRAADLVAFADPAVIAFSVVLLRRLMAQPGPASVEPLPVRFDIYGLAPIIMVLTFLGCVRVSRPLRVPAAIFSVLIYLGAIVFDVERFEPPQLLACLLVVVSAVLGSATASRITLMLERQSRLALLGSYLPASFAERLSSDAVELRAALEPVALEVTVVMTDLRGFTAMSEKMPPAEVVLMLSAYHGAMLGAVEEHHGVVDKFMGDGMLLVFGLPALGRALPPDAGAHAAVQCASALLGRLEALNLRRAQAQQPALEMGIGIHTGAVIAGTIGAGRRREFTVIGDAVNTASRLEGLTKSAGTAVLLSAATASRLGPRPAESPLRELAPMPVRGKAEPLRVFALGLADRR